MIRIIMILLLPAAAFAGGNPHNDDVDVDVNVGGDTVNVGGDTVNVGGATLNSSVGDTTMNAGDVALNSDSKSFAFAHGLGDVDINDCLGSAQWGTIIVSHQYLLLNKWCAAEVYDSKGLYKMAAILRCDIKEVSKHFVDHDECVAANTMSPPPVMTQPERKPVIVDTTDEVMAQQKELDSLERKLTALAAQQRATQQDLIRKQRIAKRTLERLENDPED